MFHRNYAAVLRKPTSSSGLHSWTGPTIRNSRRAREGFLLRNVQTDKHRQLIVIALDTGCAMYGGPELAEQIRKRGIAGVTDTDRNPYMRTFGEVAHDIAMARRRKTRNRPPDCAFLLDNLNEPERKRSASAQLRGQILAPATDRNGSAKETSDETPSDPCSRRLAACKCFGFRRGQPADDKASRDAGSAERRPPRQ
jgi:hypothetical protein